MTHYDLTIVGGGSGGLIAARLAAALGANVLLVDKERLGGDCLNYGCVPSKSLIHVARVVHQSKEAAKFGLMPASLDVDMALVSNYVQGVIRRVAEAEGRYTEGVTVKFGKLVFKSATELELNGEPFASRNTIIATGSRPAVPDIEGLAETGFLTNEGEPLIPTDNDAGASTATQSVSRKGEPLIPTDNDAGASTAAQSVSRKGVFDLTSLPATIVVVGGGPVGVELGQAFKRLGAKVTIIQQAERILPREDPDLSHTIASVLESEGIQIVTNARFIKTARDGDKKVITTKQGDRLLNFEADEIVLAVGRRPNVEGLNLEAAGIESWERGIKVNDYLQTTAPNVLAIGDVIGGYLFTHVAAYQAGLAVRNALMPVARKKVDYRVVPWCTFTDPEAARVGLTLEEAEKQYRQVRVVKFPWAEIDRAQADGETLGFIKLVLAGKKAAIVGAHMVGSHAGELLGEVSLAMQNNLRLNDILNTIHTYPTMDTGIQQAVFEAYLESPAIATNRKLVRTLTRFRR